MLVNIQLLLTQIPETSRFLAFANLLLQVGKDIKLWSFSDWSSYPQGSRFWWWKECRCYRNSTMWKWPYAWSTRKHLPRMFQMQLIPKSCTLLTFVSLKIQQVLLLLISIGSFQESWRSNQWHPCREQFLISWRFQFANLKQMTMECHSVNKSSYFRDHLQKSLTYLSVHMCS